MDKNISITVSGTQLNENGQKLLTEVAAEGQYFERGGCRYILSDETDPEFSVEIWQHCELCARDGLWYNL